MTIVKPEAGMPVQIKRGSRVCAGADGKIVEVLGERFGSTELRIRIANRNYTSVKIVRASLSDVILDDRWQRPSTADIEDAYDQAVATDDGRNTIPFKSCLPGRSAPIRN